MPGCRAGLFVIQKGKDTFVEVGNALAEIRDSRIYRNSFATFEEYCRERWKFNRDYVNKVIRAAVVVANLDTVVSKPETERQARPLTKLPAKEQPAAWAKAQEKAAVEAGTDHAGRRSPRTGVIEFIVAAWWQLSGVAGKNLCD